MLKRAGLSGGSPPFLLLIEPGVGARRDLGDDSTGVATRLVDTDFAHIIERRPLGKRNGVTSQAVRDISKVFHFYKQSDAVGVTVRRKLWSVFLHAFDGFS